MDKIAELLNCIEDSRTWPSQVLEALVSLLNKPGCAGEGGVTALRPICITALLYRTWASIRFTHLRA